MFLETHVERRDRDGRAADQLVWQIGARPDAGYLCCVIAASLALLHVTSALVLDEQDEIGVEPVQDDVSADYTGSRLDVEFEGVETKALICQILEPAPVSRHERKHSVHRDEPAVHRARL
jgi:hypothetical protein